MVPDERRLLRRVAISTTLTAAIAAAIFVAGIVSLILATTGGSGADIERPTIVTVTTVGR